MKPLQLDLYPQLQFSYSSRLVLYFCFAYMLTVPSKQPTVLPSLFRTGPTQTAAYKIQKVPQFQTVKKIFAEAHCAPDTIYPVSSPANDFHSLNY